MQITETPPARIAPVVSAFICSPLKAALEASELLRRHQLAGAYSLHDHHALQPLFAGLGQAERAGGALPVAELDQLAHEMGVADGAALVLAGLDLNLADIRGVAHQPDNGAPGGRLAGARLGAAARGGDGQV